MQRNVIAVLFFLVSLMATSCSKMDALFRNGEPVTEQRSVSQPFTVVSMYNNVNVMLVKDSYSHLELTCPKNLIDKVTTEMEGDTLVVKNLNEFNWLRSYDYSIDLTVYYDSLRSVNYCSIGELRCAEPLVGMWKPSTAPIDTIADTIPTTQFILRIHEGSGDIDLSFNCHVLKTVFRNGTSKVTLKGFAGYTEHYLDSYGTIRAEEMFSGNVKVLSNSTNDVYVWAKSTLTAYLTGIGNVYYKGNPRIEAGCSGDGRVLPLE